MPISSSYRQKGKPTAEQPWNTTKATRLSFTQPPLNTEKDESSKRLVQIGQSLNSSRSDKYPRKASVGSRPARPTGSRENSLSKLNENRKRLHPRTLSSRRPLTRRETLPEFHEIPKKSSKVFRRSNSDSLIKPCCDSAKRKVRREHSSRRTRTFPRAFATQNKAAKKSNKVDSEAKLFINNKKICFSDYHQTPQEIGQRVICVINKQLRSGVTKFIGSTHFSEGQWCGIVLDEPCGKNDGSVKGVRYFSCGENYGIFIHVHKVRAVGDLELPLQTVTDGVHSGDSPGRTTMSVTTNTQNKLNMSMNNAGRLGFKSQQSDNHYNNECNSKTRSRSFSLGMILGQKESEISIKNELNQDCSETNLSRSNSLPKIVTKKLIPDSTKELDVNSLTQSLNNGGLKQGTCSDFCNGVDFALHNKDDPIVYDDLSSKETDTCCEDSSRQNIQTKMTEEKECCSCGPQETNALDRGDVMRNCTVHNNIYTDMVSKQVDSTSNKRSYSSDYISVGNNRLTKEFSTPGLHASLERNETIDAFIQGKYCSCPSLVPKQHLSSALEACIDLGRQELESHSEKSSPVEEENYLNAGQLCDSVSKTTLKEENAICENINEKLPQRGRSVSLPLLLVPDHHISQTESLFWSLDKVSESFVKVERAESWPTLSSSICNLDLSRVHETNGGLSSFKSDCNRKSDQETLANNCVSKTLDSDGKNMKKIKKTSAVKQLNNINRPGKCDNYSLSQSGSQASVSSVGTNESQKSAQRKVSASSNSSGNSQSRKVKTKSQRNSNSKLIQKSQGQHDSSDNSGKAPMSLKLVKRHTVSGLQKFQPDLAPNSRASVTRRPTSTLSESVADSSPMGSPSYGKSKLPTIRKSPPLASATKQSLSSASKPQQKESMMRQAKGVPKGIKSSGLVAEKKKTTNAVDKDKSATQRKNSTSTPSAQKTARKVDNQMTKRGKSTYKSAVPSGIVGSGPVEKKPVTKTTVVTSSKPPFKPKGSPSNKTATSPLSKTTASWPSTTAGGPPSKASAGSSSKAAGSPTRHYTSRLPRKIISRDPSTDSTQSHEYECDVDTASVGTDGSDYFDGHRLTRGECFPADHEQYDADRSDLESSSKSWHYSSHAPDILTGTREIHTRSVEVQVQVSEDEAAEDMYNKLVHVEEQLQLKNKRCQDLEDVVANSNTDILASAMLLIILCKKLQNNGRLIMQLKNHLHSTECELKQVQERLAEEEENGVKLQEEMMYIRSEHTVAIQNLKADHENTLEALRYSMKKQHVEDQKKAADAHVAELLELSKVHEEKFAEVKKRQEKATADLHEKYKDEIVELESKHSLHIDELLEEHQVEIETIKTDYEEQYGGMESKLFAVTNECTSLNMKLQRLEEETERDIESKIQDAIEKYKSLPDELESMKAVLDMKNEENKQLRKEQMESKLEVDHLRKVAERAKKLEYENESLSFVVENKSKVERQLSVEHEQLKNSLDRESKKLKRLSLENEELQWRLFNTSSTSDGGISPDGLSESPPNSSQRRSFRLSSCSTPDVETIDE